MVYSASIAMAEASAHAGFRSWYFLARHAMFIAVGAFAAFVAFQMPMKGWQRLAPWIFVAGIALLALVFIPGVGKSVNGSRRWISLAVVNVQPSEFMKLAVVLYAASYAVRKAAFLHAEQPLKQTLVKGFLPLFRGDGRHERPAAARARLRRVRRDRRHRVRHPVSRRSRLAALPRPPPAAADRPFGHSRRRAVPPAAARSRSSIRGPIRSARATSCRIR